MACHALLLQGIFPTQGANPSLASPGLAGGFFTTSATWEAKESPGDEQGREGAREGLEENSVKD